MRHIDQRTIYYLKLKVSRRCHRRRHYCINRTAITLHCVCSTSSSTTTKPDADITIVSPRKLFNRTTTDDAIILSIDGSVKSNNGINCVAQFLSWD